MTKLYPKRKLENLKDIVNDISCTSVSASCYRWTKRFYADSDLMHSRIGLFSGPVYMIPVKRDKLCPYKRNIPVHRDEVKWNLKRHLTRENLPKRKQKETTFVGMLFMLTKLVFVLLTNYYQLFHAFFNEIDTSRSSGTSRSTEII